MTVELIRQYRPCFPIGPSFARLVPRVAMTFLPQVVPLVRSLVSPGLLRSWPGSPANTAIETQKSSHGWKAGNHGRCSHPQVWAIPAFLPRTGEAPRRSFALSNSREGLTRSLLLMAQPPLQHPWQMQPGLTGNRSFLFWWRYGMATGSTFKKTHPTCKKSKNAQCSHQNISWIFDLVVVCQ